MSKLPLMITNILEQADFNVLGCEDVSAEHYGHRGYSPDGSHFIVTIVVLSPDDWKKRYSLEKKANALFLNLIPTPIHSLRFKFIKSDF